MSKLRVNSIETIDGKGHGVFSYDYAAGLEIKDKNAVVRDGDSFYRLANNQSVPYTTTGSGMPENDAFVETGASSGGEGSSSFSFTSKAELDSFDTSSLEDGDFAFVKGSEFFWDGSLNKWKPTKITLEAFGAKGDGSDDKQAIEDAIDFANSIADPGNWGGEGTTIYGLPGSNYGYTGRITLRPGVSLSFGRGGWASKLTALSNNGGINLVAGSELEAELREDASNHTGPHLLIDTAVSTEEEFGTTGRFSRFDVGIKGQRQQGSVGLKMSAEGGKGVAWVVGFAQIGEVDFPVRMISKDTGYVNENWLDIHTYDGIESMVHEVQGSGEIAGNRIRMTTQTGAANRSGFNLKSDGHRNFIELLCWDWEYGRLDKSYSGAQVIFTEKSGANLVSGFVSRSLGAYSNLVEDHSKDIRRNNIILDDMRAQGGLTRSITPFKRRLIGPQDDMLAFANHRYNVSSVGLGGDEKAKLNALFSPGSGKLDASGVVNMNIDIDLGEVRPSTECAAIGVLFDEYDQFRPDKVWIYVSEDNSSWDAVVAHTTGNVPSELYRLDGSGIGAFRYIRLRIENDSAKRIQILSLWAKDDKGFQPETGAWAPLYNPKLYGNINLEKEYGGDGLKIDGQVVVTSQRGAIGNASAGNEVAKINEILSALRGHGLISG